MKQKIVDVHVHVYPKKIAVKASNNIGNFYHMNMRNDGTIENMLLRAKDFDVIKFIINSVATTHHQVKKINDFMASFVGDDRYMPLATLHPSMDFEEIKDEVQRIKELGLNGIKLHPDFQEFKLNGNDARKLFTALGDFGMPILVHTGDKRLDYSHPQYMIDIANDYPHLTFIAAHFGGFSEWDQALRYRGIKNIYFDTSSTLFKLDKQIAKMIILNLGVDRFMFGTDYPMWNMNEEVEKVLKMGLSEENNQKIFYKNAMKLFCIN